MKTATMTKAARRVGAFLTALLLCVCCVGLSSCVATGTDAPGTVRVICTVFPLYDWARVLTDGVDGVETVYLEANGADVHSYEPTVSDLSRIAEAELFIYIGGESDGWVDGTLQSVNSRAKPVPLMERLTGELSAEVSPLGAEDDEEEEEEDAYDEHIWLSPRLAASCVRIMAEELTAIRHDDAERIKENLNSYLGKLEALDRDFREMSDGAKRHTVIVADRFPFAYLMNDYGITAYAAFKGCSAESEASFRTVANLAEAKKENGIRRLLVTETNRTDIAGAIAEASGGIDGVEVLDSLQSVTEKLARTTDYLSVMRNNLLTLSAVLN